MGVLSQQNIFRRQFSDSSSAFLSSYQFARFLDRQQTLFWWGIRKENFAILSTRDLSLKRNCFWCNNDATSWRNKKKKFESFCLALDESNDTSNTAQLLIFIRGIREFFEVVEESASLTSLRDTTIGKDCSWVCIKLWRKLNALDRTKGGW
jgi:hypothetical protein